MITQTLSETTLVIDLGGVLRNFAVTLKSAAAGRKIEVSVDGGVEYFTRPIDVTTESMLVIFLNAPLTHLKVTGAVNDILILAG